MWSYLIFANQFQRCTAQNAFFLGIRASLESKSSRRIHRWQLDLLSIPNCIIKKRRPHGARHGQTAAQKEHFIAHNARKRCVKKVFEGIHDRFQKDLKFRDSELEADRTEEKCMEMDELAQKDFTYCPPTEEFERSENLVSLTTSGRNAPMNLRSEFGEAVTKLHRLDRESGEERPARLS